MLCLPANALDQSAAAIDLPFVRSRTAARLDPIVRASAAVAILFWPHRWIRIIGMPRAICKRWIVNSCFRSSFGPRRCWRRDSNVPSVVTIRRVSVSHRGIHVHFGLTIANGGTLRIHHPARRHPVGEHFIVSAAVLSLAPRERVASNAPRANATIMPRAKAHHHHHGHPAPRHMHERPP